MNKMLAERNINIEKIMDIIKILKTTAISAPVPTLVAVVAYNILPMLIESELSTTKLIIVSVLTFSILFSILFYGISNRSAKEDHGNLTSENEICDVEIEDGDVFIGSKGSSQGETTQNRIKSANAKNGDIFIGNKE